MAYKGIDVSSNNGIIDWEAVMEHGIEFAIIRIGYGNDTWNQDDVQAAYNMDECERLGIPYGIYLYSYAMTEDEAVSEAQHTLRMAEGRNPQLGIWYDMEDADGYKRKHGMNVYEQENREQLTEFCKMFCDRMDAEGYITGIYANKDYFTNVLLQDELDGYYKWLAHWGIDEPDMDCIMWQYTSDGRVDGVKTRADMNYYYGEI